MTDLSPKIFDELWTMERELKEAGKWPSGAPGLVVDGWSPAIGGGWDKWPASGEGRATQLPALAIDAAMNRVKELVAWWWQQGPDPDETKRMGEVNGDDWYEAAPTDWLAAAMMVLEDME